MLERIRPNSGTDLRNRTQPPRRHEMDAVAPMAAGIAHDLNNVLMIVSGNVDLLRHGCARKRPNGSCARALQFSDTGLGIPAHLIARVFEPFFMTKEMGKGTGLGLTQVYEFARQAGGYVTVSSLPKAGTTVTIYLRRVQKGAREKPRCYESELVP